MTMTGGVSAIFTTMDDNDPLREGAVAVGTSNKASHGDHVHPALIPIGVYVENGVPYLETTSTLPYIWTPSNVLYWDSTLELFTY